MIKVPSLVKRLDDIPILSQYFVELICKEQGLEKKEFSKEALSKTKKSILGQEMLGNSETLLKD